MTHSVQNNARGPAFLPSLGAADELLARQPILGNTYFTQLADGQLEQETFVRTQRQFFHAVRFFPRAMAALMSRLPDSGSRRALMHNLAEEHGLDEEGRGGLQPAMAHDQTFSAFLATLGIQTAVLVQERQGPAVRAFNLALIGACQSEPLPLAFSCLGMIEYAFADISALIGRAVVEHGWIRRPELVHYKLHAEIDKRHAADFFHAAEESCAAGGSSRQELNEGLAVGHYIFNRLYSDLLAEK